MKKLISEGKRLVGVLAGLRFKAGQTRRPMLLGRPIVGDLGCWVSGMRRFEWRGAIGES